MPLSDRLSDDQLKQLLDDYFESTYPEDAWHATLGELVARIQERLLNLPVLEGMSNDGMVEEVLDIYRAIVRVPMYYKTITGHPRAVREALRYLIESQDTVPQRVDALMIKGGAHNIGGLGKSFWSIFVMALDPSQNPCWTNKTESALEALGMFRKVRGDTPGAIYQRVAEAQLALVGLHSQADLYGIDHFMHYVTVLEGEDTIRQWTEPATKTVDPTSDKWALKIAQWRQDYLDPERAEVRQEAEAEARELLENNLGEFDEEMLRRFFELINTDHYDGDMHKDRFSPGFVGAHTNRIAREIDAFNEWARRLWQSSESELEQVLDTFWDRKVLPYAGKSVPSAILYLRDPSRYYVWLDPMARGLQLLTGVHAERQNGATYLRYCEAVGKLEERYDLRPQEMDVILVLADREAEVPEPPKKGDGAFAGFVPDTFDFLRELRDNNNKDWMASRKQRYQDVLREPLRALFQDIGPQIVQLDPNLEIEAKFGKVMASINKRFADDEGDYHPYLWGAFYRADRKKQTDAQIFASVHARRVSVGVGVGREAKEVLELFRQNLRLAPKLFYDILSPLQSKGVILTTDAASGSEDQAVIAVDSPEDVSRLLELDFINIERRYDPEDQILYQPAFAAEAMELFQDLYPLYQFFVSEDLSQITRLINEDEEDYDTETDEYTFEQLQAATFCEVDFLQRLEKLLLDKGQIVLYGPPGTGKTYVAKQFARYFVSQSSGEVRIVQFHPSYAYEEFVEGIRPHTDGTVLSYPVVPGLFRQLCDEARKQLDTRFVLIVDEINRGSLPRIFGELLYLLEYRDGTDAVILPYSQKRFNIPSNVYLIGTMNTADRSIAMVDHAIRRRFHFVPFAPSSEILRSWLEKQRLEPMAWVADLLDEVNKRLEQDQIDWHLHIGHSHWMVRDGKLDEERAELIWEYSVRPTLEEYFYSRVDRLSRYDYDVLKSLATESE